MNQLQTDSEIIHQLVHDRISGIVPIINKGEVNRVYIVKLETQSLIVRLNEGRETERFKKEQWCMSKANKIGIPSPQVLDCGVRNGMSYMLLNYIPGLNGEEVIENLPYIWNTLGKYARKIHSILTKGFGELLTNPGEFKDSWERYVRYNIDSLNAKDKLLRMEVINNDQSTLLRNHFNRLLEKNFELALTHGDISLANIIAKNKNITLLDWGSAESTIIPHFEIIGILEDSLRENSAFFKDFLDGYGLSHEEFNSMRADIDSLRLLKAVDKLRYAIDKDQKRLKVYSNKVKTLISALL